MGGKLLPYLTIIILVAVGGLTVALLNFGDKESATYINRVKIEELSAGTGPEAKIGDVLTVHYSGYLENGYKFDDSYTRGEPFVFTLGARKVIPGFEIGLQGLKVGGKRKITIPPDLGYGAQQVGDIPPNSVLVFEVELLSIE